MNHFKQMVMNIFGKNMSLLAILTTIFAYFYHGSFISWVGNKEFLDGNVSITNLLMIIMFGMGLTTTFNDYLAIVKHPRNLLLGALAQFAIMPLLGFLLCLTFNLPIELAVGVILVGCCPGGTSSNVITFMAKGDLALSIGITSLSTLLAPILTPILTTFYLGLYQALGNQTITVDTLAMFLSIVKVVVLPILAGIIINKLFSNFTNKIIGWLPVISCIAICIIIGTVIDANSNKLFEFGPIIILVIILHNIFGYGLGFIAGKIFKMNIDQTKTMSIEIGMQNSGLATSLANTCFTAIPLATVPGAIFSAWHNISGALLATYLRTKKINKVYSYRYCKTYNKY